MLISGSKVQGDSRFFNLSRSHGGKCDIIIMHVKHVKFPALYTVKEPVTVNPCMHAIYIYPFSGLH